MYLLNSRLRTRIDMNTWGVMGGHVVCHKLMNTAIDILGTYHILSSHGVPRHMLPEVMTLRFKLQEQGRRKL